MDKLFEIRRKNYIEIGQIYFWTATINKWQKLLEKDEFKHIILSSFEHLSKLNKLDVFAFVIMPNHTHTIWRTNELNGKETVQGSFLKYTAHEFKKLLSPSELINFYTNSINKNYEFWQRDSLAIHLYTPEVAFQKLDYLHNNPCTEHWQLATEPEEYQYSSASFYEMNELSYAFLKDLRLEF
ncbi:transposase [Pedobacter zeae]|uniref:Transposase n=1 Tax=Pedobacter zeae TaxID=1737356 RepID=A0A7W6P560_9SPHI|nr:transposase [Pedobacter zeae]MBB4106569.1 REP element-mobilizing transposase RayT [Pedobacter zeae]GGH02472.1 transposase [Pedobacter zeae]